MGPEKPIACAYLRRALVRLNGLERKHEERTLSSDSEVGWAACRNPKLAMWKTCQDALELCIQIQNYTEVEKRAQGPDYSHNVRVSKYVKRCGIYTQNS